MTTHVLARRRRGRGAAVVAAVVGAAAVLALAGPAGAGSAAEQRLLLTFEGDSLATSSVVHDSSGLGNDGTVRANSGGALFAVPDRSGAGTAAQYPTLGRAVITIPDNASLDVGVADFEWGADVLVDPDQVSEGANVLQKGRWSSTAGQWKLQVDSGYPSCVLSGQSAGVTKRAVLRSASSIADGQWHGLRCSRLAGVVSLAVDGLVHASRTFVTVDLSSGTAVTVGAKAATGANDQFRGTLDGVFMRVL